MKSKIESIAGLRFINALLIVFSHISFLGEEFSHIFSYAGKFGVYFFFLVSGFGLTYSHMVKCKNRNADSANIAEYSVKKAYCSAMGRMKKIYKWYLLMIAFRLPLQFYNIYNRQGMGYAVIGTVATILIMPTMLQSAFGLYQVNRLGADPFWFLSCLMILYMVYPLIEAVNDKFVRSWSRRKLYFTLLGVFALLLIDFELLNFVEAKTIFNDLSYASPYINIFIFILGILLCDLFSSSKGEIKDATVIELVLIIIFFTWVVGCNTFLGAYCEKAVIKLAGSVLIQMLVLYFFSFNEGFISKLLAIPFFVKGGGTIKVYIPCTFPAYMLY